METRTHPGHVHVLAESRRMLTLVCSESVHGLIFCESAPNAAHPRGCGKHRLEARPVRHAHTSLGQLTLVIAKLTPLLAPQAVDSLGSKLQKMDARREELDGMLGSDASLAMLTANRFVIRLLLPEMWRTRPLCDIYISNTAAFCGCVLGVNGWSPPRSNRVDARERMAIWGGSCNNRRCSRCLVRSLPCATG